ncbi:hypothetical protein N665_0466s0004 [Sinapis alba]|nr:hypothetical protein N665_0466s0004 [Sinapis alba]
MDRFVIKRKTPPPAISTDDLPCDPAKRKRIQDYDHNQRDEVRRKYLTRGPCQPRGHTFQQKSIGNYHDWLEYSVEQEKAFCFFCYLFRVQAGKQGGSDTFVSTGFSNWNRADSFSKHVGDHSSFHNDAKNKCEDLMRQGQSIKHALHKQTDIDIAHCFAEEVTKSIIQEIDKNVFVLLVDKFADVSDKEQMVVINDLRSMILKESRSSYYVHCFAHQLQLVVVAVAKKHVEVGEFFDMVHVLLNAIGASCKRKVILTESNRKRMEEGISNGTIKTGTGLNQDLSLKRHGNTRWGSHYKTLLRLDEMFPCIIEVLEYVQTEGLDGSKRQQAFGLLKYLHTFGFVFYLQLMLVILRLTNNFSKALHKRDQEILNAISDEGWEFFVAKVYSFSENNKTEVVNMEEEFVDSRRPRKKTGITNLHYYKMDCFYTVLDMQLQEFNDRFDEMNSQLLVCMASLSLIDSFRQFDKSLEQQLDIYLDNVQRDERFTNLESLGDLVRVLVDTRKHLSYPLVYRLLKLCLILHVVTTSVEMCFSAMKIMKTTSRNSIGDEFLSNCVVFFIEKQVLETVTNETVIK